MASIHQIRGALLEESILALLRASGYRTVTTEVGDVCLARHAAGIGVRGRACVHQIDAIADHVVAHPFSNPQRLLVEAKNFNDRRAVGINVIRNAIGVLKDVTEFVPPNEPVRRRYHYQYAVFTSSRFSPEAQDYAYAHDLYLLQLSSTSRMAEILRAIEDYAEELPVDDRSNVEDVDLAALRGQLRNLVQPDLPFFADDPHPYPIDGIARAVRTVGAAVVAVVARSFPVFLTPEDPEILRQIPGDADVELHIDQGDQREWRIVSEGQTWFRFDVPEGLFNRYVIAGMFDRRRALQVKAEYFREIQFVHTQNRRSRLITLRLDERWLATARAALQNRE